jgi:hypothetical protein
MANFPIMFSFTSHHISGSKPLYFPCPNFSRRDILQLLQLIPSCPTLLLTPTCPIIANLVPVRSDLFYELRGILATLASLTAMPNNPEMAKFLYTIVKQLDLKSVCTPIHTVFLYLCPFHILCLSCLPRFIYPKVST